MTCVVGGPLGWSVSGSGGDTTCGIRTVGGSIVVLVTTLPPVAVDSLDAGMRTTGVRAEIEPARMRGRVSRPGINGSRRGSTESAVERGVRSVRYGGRTAPTWSIPSLGSSRWSVTRIECRELRRPNGGACVRDRPTDTHAHDQIGADLVE